MPEMPSRPRRHLDASRPWHAAARAWLLPLPSGPHRSPRHASMAGIWLRSPYRSRQCRSSGVKECSFCISACTTLLSAAQLHIKAKESFDAWAAGHCKPLLVRAEQGMHLVKPMFEQIYIKSPTTAHINCVLPQTSLRCGEIF